MVLLTIYLVQDGSTGFLRIKASRTVERKEISLFKNGKPSYRRNAVILSIIFPTVQKVNKHTQNLSWALLQERERKDQNDENNAIYNCNFRSDQKSYNYAVYL